MADRTIVYVLPEPFNYSGPYISALLQSIRAMRDQVELDFVRFEQDAINPLSFLYRIRARDGRLWRQQIVLNQDGSELHSFSPPNAWLLSEFTLQRPIRDTLVKLIRDNTLTSVRVEISVV